MKTPREVLFEKHQQAEAKLDAVRAKCVAAIRPAATPDFTHRVPVSAAAWLRSLRWHFAGLAAAWSIILLFHAANRENSSYQASDRKTASPTELEVALRENRRQLVELMTSPISTALPPPADRRPRSAIEVSNQLA